jgi:hypothetical protein
MRLGRKGAHLAGDVGDIKPIKERQQEAVEDGEDAWSQPLAHLTRIFLQAAIAPAMQTIFNGSMSSNESHKPL